MELPLKPYERKKSYIGTVLNIIIIVLVVIILFQVIFSLTYTRVYVIGNSMYPTLTGANAEGESGGDYVLIYDGTPDYGDIVVVERYDESTGKFRTLIKRVIALGGDTVYLDHGALYIKYSGADDFVLVEESYVASWNNSPNSYNTYPKLNGEADTNGHTVAEGCMFLLGDNRNVSVDSRSDYGDFSLDELVGIVSDWSVSCKTFLTGWFTFWDYSLRDIFS